ncbi:MAG: uridine kinase [Clostridia bacterium]|nr:uridine kinase [Clostridia bacterium]
MKDVLVIGIAGGSGSGKTTLANNIAKHFGERIALLRHDDYYKQHSDVPEAMRANMNYDHPDAFDTELLISHLDILRSGESVDSPTYDYTVHDRSNTIKHVKAAPVVILEGILIFESEEILSRLDMKIFVDTEADVRILRRIMRDVRKRGRTLESVVEQYLKTVKPMHEAFVEPSKKRADIIIPEGGKNPVAYGMLIDRIEKHLSAE